MVSFLVTRMRHMGIRELWGMEKVTETRSFVSIRRNGEQFASTAGCCSGLTWSSKYFPKYSVVTFIYEKN